MVSIGIVGFGEFSQGFVELYKVHPDIGYIAGAELIPERREKIMEEYGIDAMYSDFDTMLRDDKEINCVAIFTQRHQHGPMIIKALEAGKHVFTAVPMGCTVEEIKEIIRIVEEKRLIFMVAETCYYFPCAIYCREKYKNNEFGKFIYGASQYYHDINEMFKSFQSLGDNWKRVAGIPPMYYSTHSMSMLFSAIEDYPTEVSCQGYEDTVGDGIYGVGNNDWDNPFSNEIGMFKMSKGGFVRINEFRRIGTLKPSSYISGIYGENGAYECSGMQHMLVKGILPEDNKDIEDPGDLLNTIEYVKNKENLTLKDSCIDWKYTIGYSKIHDIERLPKYFRNLEEWSKCPSLVTGHNGSHAFLVDDFVRAVVSGKLPPNNAWESATYTIPGIIAHDSAVQGGKTLEIPFLGNPPEDWERLTFEHKEHYEDEQEV